jgi:hypothetical protein
MMKAITVWQPWASLVAIGAKKYETRSWATSYRGPIAIHAATKKPHLVAYPPVDVAIRSAEVLGFPADIRTVDALCSLPRGCVIAIAELVECWKIVDRYYTVYPKVGDARCIEASGKTGNVEGDEILFGNWTPGRYAWQLENVHQLVTPIEVKGHQRLWNWQPPEEVQYA